VVSVWGMGSVRWYMCRGPASSYVRRGWSVVLVPLRSRLAEPDDRTAARLEIACVGRQTAPRPYVEYNRLQPTIFTEKLRCPHFAVLPGLLRSATVELLRVYPRGTFEVVAGRRSR
jgi:hypothetical protein